MDILRQIARYIELGWAHVASCLGGPLSAPVCRSAWTWATIALLAIGFIILWKLLAWMLRLVLFRLEDAKLRARRRKVADADTMARYKVDDNKLFSSPGDKDVQQRIRDALDQKKIDEQHERHHQRLGDKKL